MRWLLAAILCFAPLCAAPAYADERAKIAERIVDRQISDGADVIDNTVSLTASALGVERANLSGAERASLQAGLTKTFIDILREAVLVKLNDRTLYSDEEVASLDVMLQSPAYKKWTTSMKDWQFNTPEMQVKVMTALLKNLDPRIVAKLAVASRESRSSQGGAGSKLPGI